MEERGNSFDDWGLTGCVWSLGGVRFVARTCDLRRVLAAASGEAVRAAAVELFMLRKSVRGKR